MNNLLVVLGVSANDSVQAERLLDLCALYHQKCPKDSILIAAAPDLHGETKTKLRISAEIGFASVEVLEVGWPKVAYTTKSEGTNNLWYEAAIHAARCYQWPFLWLEADAIPLRATWLDELTAGYYAQGKRYFGSVLASSDGKLSCLSRVAIYPRGSGGEIKEFCAGKAAFELAAGSIVVPRAGKTKLIQQLAFDANTERSKIREGAVLIHSDKDGVLLSQLIDEASKVSDVPTAPEGYVPFNGTLEPQSDQLTAGGIVNPTPPLPKRGPGRPRKNPEVVNA